MFVFFFVKQKTAYELRISDWSSDVCSSDLVALLRNVFLACAAGHSALRFSSRRPLVQPAVDATRPFPGGHRRLRQFHRLFRVLHRRCADRSGGSSGRDRDKFLDHPERSEEHTSELQSLMRISYAAFCLKKKNLHHTYNSEKQ